MCGLGPVFDLTTFLRLDLHAHPLATALFIFFPPYFLSLACVRVRVARLPRQVGLSFLAYSVESATLAAVYNFAFIRNTCVVGLHV